MLRRIAISLGHILVFAPLLSTACSAVLTRGPTCKAGDVGCEAEDTSGDGTGAPVDAPGSTDPGVRPNPGNPGTEEPTHPDPDAGIDPGTDPGACPSSPAVTVAKGTSNVGATIQGIGFGALDGFARVQSTKSGIAVVTYESALTIVLTSYANACAYVEADATQQRGEKLSFQIYKSSTSAPPTIGPGTYAAAPTSGTTRPVEPMLIAFDSECMHQPLPMRGPYTGSITLTSVTPERVKGTVNITGDRGGESMTGSFDLAFCGNGDPGMTGIDAAHHIATQSQCCIP